ncbi:histone-lysine N-methyltransferase SETMAR [Plakobranchus ocellatus]|uniref:Histone-lysine N-methyltransferase SETMAR n=1 Tax=Plakobranchus ocellatus TaxID=259542 RepID=A0AAV4B661_9GAST|nr:histone-lysine N-methyltransferase SETMAR [Plakobranchus ocellatus]
MATLFWGAKGVILLDIMSKGQCIYAACCCDPLNSHKRSCASEKKPGLLTKDIALQHDSATRHMAHPTVQTWQHQTIKRLLGGKRV